MPNAPNNPAARFKRTRDAHRDEIAEDYVEAIAQLCRERGASAAGGKDVEGRARVKDLATMMGVSHVTVVKTVSRLRKLGLVEGERGRPFRLTAAGRQIASSAHSKHLVVLSFLRAIGVPARQAEIDAEGIEHHVSEATIRAMKRLLTERASVRSGSD